MLAPFPDPACPIDWSHPCARGITHFWAAPPLSGWKGGKTYRDLVRGGRLARDATLSAAGAVWAAGNADGFSSLSLNGTTGYAVTGRISTATDNFTGAALVTGGGSSANFAFYNGTDPGGWGFGVADDGTVGGLLGAVAWVHSSATPPTGWYTIVFTRLNGTITVYLNGRSVGTSASTPAAPGNDGNIGGEGDGSGNVTRLWAGKIGAVVIKDCGTSAAGARALDLQLRTGLPDLLRWVRPAWAASVSPPPPPPAVAAPYYYRHLAGGPSF